MGMARQTRSANGHIEPIEDENEQLNNALDNKTNLSSKKRKRNSIPEIDDAVTIKQSRTGTEELTTREDNNKQEANSTLPLSGDLPLNDDDAQKILDILDMVDTQGLLDRVFPLDDVLGVRSTSASTSKTPANTYSLRTLLTEARDHTLRICKSAVKHLYPLSSQPRSKMSPIALQQRQFCELALSLLEQASFRNTNALSLDIESVLSDRKSEVDGQSESSRTKYALVQKLPTGELWTSLNTDFVDSDDKPLTDLGTGYAQLAAILPSSSSSKPVPTFGDLHSGKKQNSLYKPPTSRRISCGTFLDYGPYASFAPTFDNDGGDIGQLGVSSVLWRGHEKSQAREKARILKERMQQKLAQQAQNIPEPVDAMEVDSIDTGANEFERMKDRRKELIERTVGIDESRAVLDTFDALDREEQLEMLLQLNARALLRLNELQRERLCSIKGNSTDIKIGSEEWNLAEKIMDSLVMIASLRPRKPDGSTSALIPSSSTLHALHGILPSQPSQGWYGTLSENRGLAVRDDTTILVKPTNQTSTTTSAPVPAPVPQTPASTYSPYTNYSQYRPGASLYATPGQTSNYYPNTYYSNTPQAQKGTSVLRSRLGTPTPNTVPTSITGSTYSPYSSAYNATNPIRAVANTVSTPIKTSANGWATTTSMASALASTGYALPPHMRTIGSQPPMSPLSTQNYTLASHASTPTPSSNA
ncbi:hypothetical protein PNOK_0186900 [Pyrrhoderma noxium]|uniref:Uncharacterized protein n=1 Tax=Pyrrhoderma noxium TaxID=2282107 RepID=A0A286UQR3_9AGAM|nr:hypothetical protein PNOK_0186900 [Pyrrhoderma noxium]